MYRTLNPWLEPRDADACRVVQEGRSHGTQPHTTTEEIVMAYTRCTDKDCTWEATGNEADVDRAYGSHRKRHKAAKEQTTAVAVTPVVADPAPEK